MSAVPQELATHSFLEGMSPDQVERVTALATRRTFEAGDHLIYLGEVQAMRLDESRDPLLYQSGAYGRFSA